MSDLHPETERRLTALATAMSVSRDEAIARAVDTLFAGLRPPMPVEQADAEPAPSPTEQVTPNPKPKTERSDRYMAFVRTHSCCSCFRSATRAIEAHHAGKGSMGKKASDFTCVPLCTECHRAVHDTGRVPNLDAKQTKTLFKQVQRELLETWRAKQ